MKSLGVVMLVVGILGLIPAFGFWSEELLHPLMLPSVIATSGVMISGAILTSRQGQ
ncbi:MAG: hypothetical protein ACP5HU_10180 [Phycisphaerae bacterium]